MQDSDVIKALVRAVDILKEDHKNTTIEVDEKALNYFAASSNGDVRKAINGLEVAINSTNPNSEGVILIDEEVARDCTQSKVFNYDMSGDSHYDILSAFQKSIRGSDADAAVHYLARLVKAGDIQSICRRLMVIASEDIGLAYPNAAMIVKSCVDSANMLGFPEARIPLAQATLVLATAPKSNSVVCAIDAALQDIEQVNIGDIPVHLKDAHYSVAKALGRGIEYKYPHNYENNYIKQQYLPDNLKSRNYYVPGKNKNEKVIFDYWKKVEE
ncbi:hypothetical protein CSC2_20290 [Clostridium zeae]|uniref:Replication-associated recombination protein A n=1 Tax=Clostridium zeae TaxID=2759022 RepID=A0ABQ1EAG2_9CLOT|nr:hypothetical protein [Clostridium zeae]GFZ31503.1 hypothetical protein CSC2_20290 [Clostridium zeae]